MGIDRWNLSIYSKSITKQCLEISDTYLCNIYGNSYIIKSISSLVLPPHSGHHRCFAAYNNIKIQNNISPCLPCIRQAMIWNDLKCIYNFYFFKPAKFYYFISDLGVVILVFEVFWKEFKDINIITQYRIAEKISEKSPFNEIINVGQRYLPCLMKKNLWNYKK